MRRRPNWIVRYPDGKQTARMPKQRALDLMVIFDGVYVEKVDGWWRRKIYRCKCSPGPPQ